MLLHTKRYVCQVSVRCYCVILLLFLLVSEGFRRLYIYTSEVTYTATITGVQCITWLTRVTLCDNIYFTLDIISSTSQGNRNSRYVTQRFGGMNSSWRGCINMHYYSRSTVACMFVYVTGSIAYAIVYHNRKQNASAKQPKPSNIVSRFIISYPFW